MYNRTRDLLGSDADAPSIEVRETDRRIGASDHPFLDLIGLSNGGNGTDGVGAAAVATPGSVVVNKNLVETANERYAGNQTARDYTRLLLAHEFTHTVQYEEAWDPVRVSSTEESLRANALLEGGAVFTADRYAEATGIDASELARLNRSYRNAPKGAVYGYAPYYHGGQYFETVADHASELEAIYEDDLPPTTEGILFPGANNTGKDEINVTAAADRDGWEYKSWMDETYGAMFVHTVVTAQTDIETADEAAAGWATDRLLTFESEAGQSYAWVTHWDSAADATEFETALEATLANRTDDAAEHVTLSDAGDRTVVVLAGDETFREAVTVSGTGSSVEGVLPSEDAAT